MLLAKKTRLSVVVCASCFALSACAQVASPAEPTFLRTGLNSDPVPQASSMTAYDIGRLEQRVAELEAQMKAAQPSLRKAEALDAHFRSLSVDLDKINSAYYQPVEPQPVHKKIEPAKTILIPDKSPAPVVEKKPLPKVVLPEQHKKVESPVAELKPVSAPIETDTLQVRSIRIGEQPKGITRIVLDSTKPAEIRYDLDNEEGLLVVDIPGASWSATESMTLRSSQNVASFKSSEDGSGSHLILQLKRKAKVMSTARLTPEAGLGNRIYLDIAGAE